MYNKSWSCLQSVAPLSFGPSPAPAPAAAKPAPHVKEEEVAAAPGPSQVDDDSINEFNLLMPHAVCSAQHWNGKCALLAQGIKSIYNKLPSPADNYLLLPDTLGCAFVASAEPSQPKTFCNTMQRPDTNLWCQATVKEMEAHMENDTWEIV